MAMRLKRQKTMRCMVFIPMLAINMLIVAILVIIIAVSDFFGVIRRSEIDTLHQSAQYNGSQVQKLLNELSIISISLAGEVSKNAHAIFSDNENIGIALKTQESAQDFLNASVSSLVDALKMNKATGAFVVLNTSFSGNGFGSEKLSAIYLNDNDLTGVHSDNADLMMLYGMSSIARELRIPLDNYWGVEMNMADYSEDFLIKPYETASARPDLNIEKLLYWSAPVTRSDGRDVFYSIVPLRDFSGNCYGLAGIEISADRLKSMMHMVNTNFGEDIFYYMMDCPDDPFTGEWLLQKGVYAYVNALDGQMDSAGIDYWQGYEGSIFSLSYPSGADATVASYPFSLYYAGSPYESEDNWILLYGVDSDTLFQNSGYITIFFSIAVLIALVSGVLCSFFVSRWVVKPLLRVSGRVSSLDPDEEVKIERTGVAEIDVLVDSIESLSLDLIDASSHTIKTIEMINPPIGFFKIDQAKNRVFLTDRIFDIFGAVKSAGSSFVPISEWYDHFRRLVMYRDESGADVYYLDGFDGRQPSWLRIKTVRSNEKTSGVVMDITSEVLEKKRLARERDTDPLTGLYTRRAFFAKAYEMINSAPGMMGVMIFTDLDKLKPVNDTYGHDFGDRYIRTAAEALSWYETNSGVVARLSGDEFAAFVYGGEDKEELRDIVNRGFEKIQGATLDLPDSTVTSVRSSMGYSWYPDDSQNLETLLKYSDFAMYEAKNAMRGTIREFLYSSYAQNSTLPERDAEFDNLITDNMIDYAFQPIIDVKNGAIFAYEALMRPRSSAFLTPGQVLKEAKFQAKLYHVERMTLYNIFKWISGSIDKLKGRKLFYNIMPDLVLNEKDSAELEFRYAKYFPQTVAEISGREYGGRVDYGDLVNKVSLFRRLGCAIAVDTRAAGLNGNEMPKIETNYIKISIDHVKNAHNDETKREMIRGIIENARSRKIAVIAEGIETEKDAREMIALGVDYLQGYYIAMPAFELEDADKALSEKIRAIYLSYHRGEAAKKNKTERHRREKRKQGIL